MKTTPLAIAIVAMLLGCSDPSPGPAISGATFDSTHSDNGLLGTGDGAASGDGSGSGSGDGTGSGLGDGSGDGGGDGVGKVDTACPCTNVACGPPSAKCSNSCGDCAAGSICLQNKCEPDPKCACNPGACNVLPGCGASCGNCPAKQLCNKNFCEPLCNCAGVECGPLPGCTLSCGDCNPGLACAANECVEDPKCACKPGMCGTVPGCAKACGGCGAGQACVGNVCKSGLDCDCAGLKCGFKSQNCAISCGACTLNQTCIANTCKAEGAGKKALGGSCLPTAECQPPPPGSSQFAQNQYLVCLGKLCKTDACVDGVCSQPCTIAADAKNNATGLPGADGIEDPDAVSECAGAIDGAFGKGFRCVEQASPAQVQQGITEAVCLPGSTFKPCQRNGDCDKGDVCRLYVVQAELVARCGPKVHNPSGSAPASGGLGCNDNAVVGPVALCENNNCTAKGCVELCKTDADCLVGPGACKTGKCSANGKVCKVDADCPVWACAAGVQPVDNLTQLFSMCQPK